MTKEYQDFEDIAKKLVKDVKTLLDEKYGPENGISNSEYIIYKALQSVADNCLKEIKAELHAEKTERMVEINARKNVEKQLQAYKDALRVAKEELEFIGCRTDHGDQEPCLICKTVDNSLTKINELIGENDVS